MQTDQKYDIIVVGAGPAGSLAAKAAAESGASVLMLEKDRKIGVPVRCAEAIGEDIAKDFFPGDFDQRWVAATINRFKLVAPDGTEIYPQVKLRGYVLNRQVFDADLAARAANAGADVITRANVTGLLFDGEQVAGVRCRVGGIDLNILGRMVIGADGVESRVGRWGGISSEVPMRDMETCYQVTLGNISVEPDMCSFYFSQVDFPGGYAWVFPKDGKRANVGLGIAGNQIHGMSPEQRLIKFTEKYFPDSPVLSMSIGGVPCADRPSRISGNGIMLAGDAACQTNPISGGGIAGALLGGRMAGLLAAEAVKKGNISYAALAKYEKMWDDRVGRNQRINYKIKLAIQKLTDQDLNETAKALKNLPQKKQTLTKIFQIALKHKPSLVIEVAKLFSPFS